MPWIKCRVLNSVRSTRQVLVEVAVISQPGERRQKIILLDSWMETSLKRGTILNLYGEADSQKKMVFSDSTQCLVVKHPDILVTVTEIAQGIHCERKGALKSIFKRSGPSTYWQFRGLVFHSVIHDILSGKEVFNGRPISEVVQDTIAVVAPDQGRTVGEDWTGQCAADLSLAEDGIKELCGRCECKILPVSHGTV